MSTDDITRIAPRALEFLADAVNRVSDDEWDLPSNLEGWSVRDVVAHVTGSVAKMSAQIENTPIAGAPSEPAAWHRDDQGVELRTQIDRVLALLPDAPLGHLRNSPAGEMPLVVALAFPTVDAIVHAWDVERSCGRRLEVPDDLLGYAQALTAQLGDVADKSPSFAAPQPCPDTASPTEQLMARLGRAVD